MVRQRCSRFAGWPGDHPRVTNEPDLWSQAIEEFLRYDGPSKAMWRVALEPMVVAGRELAAQDKVLLVQASANRDPAIFESPDRLDVTRSKNPHCGFGFGIHYCIGAQLARTEGRIALSKLFERFPRLDLPVDPGQLEWQPTLLNPSLRSLPVKSA